MKIGILTLPFNHNYGGYLQAYALMTVLKRMGHEVWLINRKPDGLHCSMIRYLKARIKMLITREFIVYNTKSREKLYKKQGKNILPFLDKYLMPKTEEIKSSNDFRKIKKHNFEALIVGSDQVWRAKYVPGIADFYFAFAEQWQVKRIAYAASFGTDEMEYTEEDIERCGALFKKFNAASVREKSAISLIKDKYHWSAQTSVEVVLDPTMLLTKQDYEKCCISNNNTTINNTLFCYILDDVEGKAEILAQVAKELNCELKLFTLGSTLPSIEDWLKSIMTAKYVITDSFHGTVFSALFNRPFISIGNPERGLARMVDLLEIIDLRQHLVTDFSFDIAIRLLSENTYDWNSVNSKIDILRNESLNFLMKNL
ncbi:polysaccharide pyruvyl transferase family protein [Phocaeicola sp.]